MSQHDFDVAILGGGPTGSTLALLLARATARPERIALLQADSQAQYGYAPALDPRVLAINHGSRVLLESLHGFPEQAAQVQTVHVSQRGRLGRTLIRHSDFGVEQLGCVVRYAGLHARLTQAIADSGITVLRGPAARLLRQDRTGVEIGQGGEIIRAALLVQADGQPETEITRQYAQVALLTQAQASLPRAGWAFERFTQEGPLAVLPHPDGIGQQSIVWCCAPERASLLHKLSAEAFSEALTQMFGSRLGTLSVRHPVAAFPLIMNLRQEAVRGRAVAIGNAAQTLHPVAGQGLNLGLRDAATLAFSLREWLSTPSVNPAQALEQFQRLRQPDRALTARMTDLMSRVFTTRWPVVEHAAGLALLGLDLIPALRAPLARHLLQGMRR
jgi:2-octaprenyl-6-methoxyphenol hydroxylase